MKTDKKRVILIVLDSVGVGELPDADQYGDLGSNTLSNVVAACGGLSLPRLEGMGLGLIEGVRGLNKAPSPSAAYGRLAELSPGKDTTTGHWEIAGIVLDRPFPTYPQGFPKQITDELTKLWGVGFLGNSTASGTVILDELGERHMSTGLPILYTSADSVLQIAAHEEVIPLQELYRMCELARGVMIGDLAVGRVIARPFTGSKKGGFVRTPNRRDYTLKPISRTVLNALEESGREVCGVGKIEDIFSKQGLTKINHAVGNEACVNATLDYMNSAKSGLIFTNLVDFDMEFGHRNNPTGYGQALEYFDRRLGDITAAMRDGDVLIITADHGCDPTTPSTDHSREYVPLLIYGSEVPPAPLGTIRGFNYIAQYICDSFGLADSFWRADK